MKLIDDRCERALVELQKHLDAVDQKYIKVTGMAATVISSAQTHHLIGHYVPIKGKLVDAVTCYENRIEFWHSNGNRYTFHSSQGGTYMPQEKTIDSLHEMLVELLEEV